MHESRPPNHTSPSEPSIAEADRLITRLIDGECAAGDRARFEQLAQDDPSLWREFALRQIDAVQLCAETRPILDRLAGTPFPRAAPRAPERTIATTAMTARARADRAADQSSAAPLLHVAAWSGWAAVLLLAAIWAALATTRTVSDTGARQANETPGMATPARLWNDYLALPHVHGELEPIVLETIERPGGEVVLRYLRRVEEEQTFGSVDEVPRSRGGPLRLAPPETSRSDDAPAAEPVRP